MKAKLLKDHAKDCKLRIPPRQMRDYCDCGYDQQQRELAAKKQRAASQQERRERQMR